MAAAGPAQRTSEAVAAERPQALMSVRGLGIRFKTSQGVIRMGGYNYKGVFTRDRRPKLAAHRLREIWRGDELP